MTDAARLSARDRLRMAARKGSVATVGAPIRSEFSDDFLGNESISGSEAAPGVFQSTPGVFAPAPDSVQGAAHGVFQWAPEISSPAPDIQNPNAKVAAAVIVPLTPAQKLSEYAASQRNVIAKTSALKELAAMKTLTRLLEAVYSRPGSSATVEERMVALITLSTHSMTLGAGVAKLAGEDVDRSNYIRAVSMEAVVGLVCKSWHDNRDIDWEKLLSASVNHPEVVEAAEAMAMAAYRPVKTVADASDRLAVSLHGAYWHIYALGDTIDGITPQLAAEMTRSCADYLNTRDRFVPDNDLQVSWMQGSIRRVTDLVCAEARARFAGKNVTPTQADISSVLNVAFTGFEGVENYAQSILERPGSAPAAHPVAG